MIAIVIAIAKTKKSTLIDALEAWTAVAWIPVVFPSLLASNYHILKLSYRQRKSVVVAAAVEVEEASSSEAAADVEKATR